MSEQSIRIALAGASGRMGAEVLRLMASQPDRYRLVAAWVGADSTALGRDAGDLARVGSLGCLCSRVGETNDEADAIVDFSTPDATCDIMNAAIALKVAWVSGVTGLGDDGEALLDRASKAVPVLHTDNFSLGIAVLAELAVLAQTRLGPAFDIEIDEVHHRGKRDAPSGTARMLGRALGDNGGSIRTGAREDGEIGYSVRRGGGVCGEHAVHFLGSHERLELTHRADGRSLFAEGALTAAAWLVARPPGRYAFRDVVV